MYTNKACSRGVALLLDLLATATRVLSSTKHHSGSQARDEVGGAYSTHQDGH